MQLNHVRDIDTVKQTFHAKLYFRATWVQDKPKKSFDKTCGTLLEEIYRPRLTFQNAIDVVEFKEQTLEESSWRVPNPPKDPSGREQVVMEWSAKVSAVFLHKFSLDNYPNDYQLLKITMTAIDKKKLFNDCFNDVTSAIRTDYFLDTQLSIVKELPVVCPQEKKCPQEPFSFKKSDTDSSGNWDGDCRGHELFSIREKFKVSENKRSNISSALSYIIQCKRIRNHPMREILYPVSLIGTASFVTFVYPVNQPKNRFSVSITVALVMTSYMYIMSQYLPRTKEVTILSKYVLYSFFLVFFILFEIAFSSFFTCGRYCDSEEEEEGVVLTSEVVDWVIAGICIFVWSILNIWIYIKVLIIQIFAEKARVRKSLEKMLKLDEQVFKGWKQGEVNSMVA